MDKWLERFLKEAVPILMEKLTPEKLVIFGSRVKGNASPTSDIDVIIVSKFFEGMHFLRRPAYTSRLVQFPIHVDFICYTPTEFDEIKNGGSVLVEEALEEGLTLL